MNVYFIGNMADGCYQVRCLLPQIHNGWNGSTENLTEPRKSKEQIFREAMMADIIVFQRPTDDEKVKLVKLLQQAGKKVVFDNDDTYKPNSGVPTAVKRFTKEAGDKLRRYNKNIISFIKQADLVTTTTEFLADEYRQYNKNVIVLPNCIDPFNWDEPLRSEGDKIRVGLVGSVSANDEYEHIKEAIYYLKGREDVEIVVYGLPPKDSEAYKIAREVYKKEMKFWDSFVDERQPQTAIKDYFRTLNELRLDLMLIPRQENYFNKCKSNIKYLEASMCEIPVIAQGFTDKNSPYDKDIDGTNGIIVKTGRSWIPALKKLLNNKELRREMGRNAKQYTLKHFNIENNYKKWAEAYANIK
jgi:processive 1,2-diacylglycerol beta-glucosyltransferase